MPRASCTRTTRPPGPPYLPLPHVILPCRSASLSFTGTPPSPPTPHPRSYAAPPLPQTFTHAPHLIASAPSPHGRGAVVVPDGSGAVSVKVWAPHAASVSVLLGVSAIVCGWLREQTFA